MQVIGGCTASAWTVSTWLSCEPLKPRLDAIRGCVQTCCTLTPCETWADGVKVWRIADCVERVIKEGKKCHRHAATKGSSTAPSSTPPISKHRPAHARTHGQSLCPLSAHPGNDTNFASTGPRPRRRPRYVTKALTATATTPLPPPPAPVPLARALALTLNRLHPASATEALA
ncbi:hypothetical protein D9615_007784 [Tricholomella constricta]|uniref:Uncharacterized protein n=1 Tax=Tricholomella constricta TaxID=117010 RepID=A0A8H5H4M9_9AGAR|nr:hypothetical protein D9615_007784 [Tricholomella constricta]